MTLVGDGILGGCAGGGLTQLNCLICLTIAENFLQWFKFWFA